jgi:SH3-like domain-containing protein
MADVREGDTGFVGSAPLRSSPDKNSSVVAFAQDDIVQVVTVRSDGWVAVKVEQPNGAAVDNVYIWGGLITRTPVGRTPADNPPLIAALNAN